jgi:hypothetical protein
MPDKIKVGSILIEEGALLPETLRFESEAYLIGWKLVKNLDAYGLDRKIREAGWNFFYMAGEIKASVFGFGGEKSLRRAVSKVLASTRSDALNSLEITQVVAKRFLMLPYLMISAHSRHIQESMSLSHAKRLARWCRAKLATAPA